MLRRHFTARAAATALAAASAPLFTSALASRCGNFAAVRSPVAPLMVAPMRHCSSGGKNTSTSTNFDTSHPLASQLSAIINSNRIVIFLTGTPRRPQCGFTVRLVELLDQLPINYEYYNIMQSDEICEGLKEYSGWPTYPQVYVDGELIGGFDIVSRDLRGFLALLDSKGLVHKNADFVQKEPIGLQ